jgi:hypothetical protein
VLNRDLLLPLAAVAVQSLPAAAPPTSLMNSRRFTAQCLTVLPTELSPIFGDGLNG